MRWRAALGISVLLWGVKMAASRCSGGCNTNWPVGWRICPECDEPTSYMMNAKPIPEAEAKRRKAKAEFAAFCAKREDERIARGEPSPEEIGRERAQEIIALERQLAE